MTPWLVLYAAIVNYIVSMIFVESHLFRPVRLWIIHESLQIQFPAGVWHHIGNKHSFVFPPGTTQEEYDAIPTVPRGPWLKLGQLVTCQLCTRTWVGFAEAAYFSGPNHGWAAPIANGLLYAGAGHLIFELRSRVALVEPMPDAQELLGNGTIVGDATTALQNGEYLS